MAITDMFPGSCPSHRDIMEEQMRMLKRRSIADGNKVLFTGAYFFENNIPVSPFVIGVKSYHRNLLEGVMYDPYGPDDRLGDGSVNLIKGSMDALVVRYDIIGQSDFRAPHDFVDRMHRQGDFTETYAAVCTAYDTYRGSFGDIYPDGSFVKRGNFWLCKEDIS